MTQTHAAAGASAPRILVVEDEPGDARLLKILIADAFADASIDVVALVSEAEAYLGRQDVDVILCDLNLPDRRGPEILTALRAWAWRAALVTVTGQAERETALAALEAGAQEYLVKGEIDAPLLRRTILQARQTRRAEIDLERARFIVESSLDGFMASDLDGRISDVNDAYCRMVGKPRQALIGSTVADLRFPGRDADVADRMATIKAEGTARFETLHAHADGHPIEVEVSAHYRPHNGGEILSFLRDVTDRNRLSRDLEASERRFRDVSAAAGEYLWEVNAEGHYIYASDRIAQVHGYTPAEVIGRTPFEFMPPEEAERVGSWFAQVAAEGAPFRDLEHRGIHKRGHVIWQRVSGMPITDADGRLVGYRGTAMDITLRRRDQEILKDRERRLTAILHAVADAVIAIDAGGKVQSFNPAAERIFAWTANEVIGQTIDMLMPEPYASAHQGYVDNFLRSGEAKIIGKGRELVGLRSDGTTFPMDLTVTEAGLDAPRLFIGIVRDITDRKAMEDDLRRLATTDPLTGAANRRRFMEVLDEETARGARLGHPVSVAMMDIDHFKRLNDTYGHAAGDAALIRFVAEIKERLRETDTLGRLGGEEFALVLPGTSAEQALVVVESLRARREAEVLVFEDQELRFTLSAGVTDTSLTEAPGLLAAADAALYRSKDTGRNRVTVAERAPAEQV